MKKVDHIKLLIMKYKDSGISNVEIFNVLKDHPDAPPTERMLRILIEKN